MKMRAEEDEALLKCRATLKKMKMAMLRQKNISIEVKNGVSELDELFDIIASLRRNWIKAEKDTRRKNATKSLEACNQNANVSTPVTALPKRTAPSPVEQESEKRGRGPGNTVWHVVKGKRNSRQNETKSQNKPLATQDGQKANKLQQKTGK